MPPEQMSVVQASLSLQLGGLHVGTLHTPSAGSQDWPAGQVIAVPAQTPPAQTSPVVQRLLSVHVAVLLVNTHPDAGLQESFVQGLLSLQVIGVF